MISFMSNVLLAQQGMSYCMSTICYEAPELTAELSDKGKEQIEMFALSNGAEALTMRFIIMDYHVRITTNN